MYTRSAKDQSYPDKTNGTAIYARHSIGVVEKGVNGAAYMAVPWSVWDSVLPYPENPGPNQHIGFGSGPDPCVSVEKVRPLPWRVQGF